MLWWHIMRHSMKTQHLLHESVLMHLCTSKVQHGRNCMVVCLLPRL
jgi:hypothetical protein